MSAKLLFRTSVTCLVAIACIAAWAWSQNADSEPGAVVIRREPMRLIAPDGYRLPLQLEPVKQLVLAAPCDGTIQSVDAELGKSVNAQVSLVQLESRERTLMLDRSLAQFNVAELELEQAKKAGQGTELAEARLHAAEADVKLLQFHVDQLNQRAPFAGMVIKVHVQPGQFVKAGESLLTLGDVAQLKVDIPVDRETTKEGDSMKLRVENQTLDVAVDKLSPAEAKFERVRDLATSLATTTLVLDNEMRKWHVGQAVFAPLVPRYPVAEVATSAVGTDEKGRRKVQVVRQGIICDVEVNLLGQVGADRIFVSGSFVEGDSLILSMSRALADGTQIRPNPGAVATAKAAAETSSTATTRVKSADKPKTSEKKKTTSGF